MSPPEDQGKAWRRLAAAGHDLRQPVHALGLYLAVLARKEPDEELGPRLMAALDEVRDAMDMALDFAKLHAGAWKPQEREFRVAELFAPLRERLLAQARVRRIELRFVGAGWRGRGDPELLRRAFGEVAGPAIRAGRGGRILLGARRRGGQLIVEVRAAKAAGLGRPDPLGLELAGGLAALGGGWLSEEADRLALVIPAA